MYKFIYYIEARSRQRDVTKDYAKQGVDPARFPQDCHVRTHPYVNRPQTRDAF